VREEGKESAGRLLHGANDFGDVEGVGELLELGHLAVSDAPDVDHLGVLSLAGGLVHPAVPPEDAS
jgi:hypothetical protein